MTTALQVSVIVPHAMRFTAADLTTVARQVEDVGLDGVFVGEHLAATVPLAESTLVLATAAAATARIHVGVDPPPHRPAPTGSRAPVRLHRGGSHPPRPRTHRR